MSDARTRPVGHTELSWCKAVPGGTGTTVLVLLLSKRPDVGPLQNALRKLQISHPILNSKLRFDPNNNPPFSYVSSDTPTIRLAIQQSVDDDFTSDPLHAILEREINDKTWQNLDPSSDLDLFFASVYGVGNDKWVVALRLHTSVCDRTSACALLGELLEIIGDERSGEEVDFEGKVEASLGNTIEECVPKGLGNKPFWARGMDMLGYSLNSLRTSGLRFEDTVSERVSRVVRLRLNEKETSLVLKSCERNEIKLCGALAAAGLMACRSTKDIPDDQWEKYAVVTLMDCRSILDPPLTSNHIGFYHSAILNTHDLRAGEDFWELAKRVHSSFQNAKNNNKHFWDMSDLNFLMCKAIDNPGLTPSASLRTSLISVFEEPKFDSGNKMHERIGLEDFIGCASVHGVGPSFAIFDTIRDSKLDCACVYPFPLHSREQMQEFVDAMKRILLDGANDSMEC